MVENTKLFQTLEAESSDWRPTWKDSFWSSWSSRYSSLQKRDGLRRSTVSDNRCCRRHSGSCGGQRWWRHGRAPVFAVAPVDGVADVVAESEDGERDEDRARYLGDDAQSAS